MKTKIKVWHLVAITFVFTTAIILLLVFTHRRNDKLVTALKNADYTIAYYKIKVDSIQERVAEANLSVVEATRKLSLSHEEMERVKALNIRNVRTIGNLKLQIAAMQDSLILYRDSIKVEVEYIPVENSDSLKPVVSVPLHMGWEDQWAKSWADIDINGKGASGFEIKDLPISLTLGSRGVFKKSYVSDVATPNPYLTVTQNQFQIVKQPTWKPIVYSGAIGVAIGTAICVFLLAK